MKANRARCSATVFASLRRFPTRLAAIGIGLIACHAHESDDDDSSASAAPAVVQAQTMIVTPRPFTETISTIGTVAGRAGHVATLSAPAPARIARVAVALGQTVTPGMPLVELDQTSFTAARNAANAALVAAERAFERTQRLVTEGIAPRKDLDQATADLAQARATAATAERQRGLSILHAPIAGVVTRVTATLGATADPAQPLVEIADPKALDILWNVTPTDAARVRLGALVTLRNGQTPQGDSLGVATVTGIGGAVDTSSRSVTIRTQMQQVLRPLRIGETVFGQITVATNPHAIVIPQTALVPVGDTFIVFVVDAAGTAHKRPVTVGARMDADVEITSGLQAGERIVTEGAYGVEDSAKIAPSSQPAPAATRP